MQRNYINNIITDCCTLSPLHPADFHEATALFLHPEARRYLGGTISKEEAVAKLRRWSGDATSRYYSVRCTKTGAFLGIVSLSPYHHPDKTELSYQFLPEFWGNSYAFEACRTLLTNLPTGISEVIAETQTLNARSRRLLERLGFRLTETIHWFSAEQCIYTYEVIV